MSMMGQPQIRDVAAEAGVSIATVSRVLSGSRSVRPESESAVLEAAQRLGYRPNQLGRALRRQSTQVIGMVVPGVMNPFWPLVIDVAEKALGALDYALLLCTSGDDPEVESERVAMLVDRQVDGLLISPCQTSTSSSAISDAAARVPLVQIDRCVDNYALDFVGVNDDWGIRMLVDHVLASNSSRVAYVGEADRTSSGQARHAAFTRLAHENRRAFTSTVLLGDFSESWGRAAAAELFSSPSPPDAVICGNDLIALGVLEECARLGVRVPEDVVVSGYDDIDVAQKCRPSLTTVRQPINDLAAKAIELLLARMQEPQRPQTRLQLTSELVVRDSMPHHMVQP